MANIKFTIIDEYDHIIDEKPGSNTFLALRKLQWGDNTTVKLDLRKWAIDANGDEIPLKGVSFLDETKGPNTLIQTLLTTGYGDTRDTLNSIKERDDFRSSINKIFGKEDDLFDDSIEEFDEEVYYDPKEFLL